MIVKIFHFFAKIILLYAIILSVIIFSYYDLPDNFVKINKNDGIPRIAFYTDLDHFGEHQIYVRSVNGCKNLGWHCLGGKFPQNFIDYKLTKHFFYLSTIIVHYIFQPSLNINVTHLLKMIPYGKSYVYINVPWSMIISHDYELLSENKFLEKAYGIIDLNYYSTGDKSWLEKTFKKQHNISAILIGSANTYNFSTPRKILITGSLWGCNRNSLRIKQLLQDLSNQNKLVAYGTKEAFGFLGANYLGILNLGDNLEDKLVNLHKDYGIGLAIHNFEHLIFEIPTTRIIESIASGSISISDMHPFIIKNFGDNVLYFNSFQPKDKMYQEIKEKLLWIEENPEKVIEKTKKAHRIFLENFTTESNLKKIYNEFLKNEEKNENNT